MNFFFCFFYVFLVNQIELKFLFGSISKSEKKLIIQKKLLLDFFDFVRDAQFSDWIQNQSDLNYFAILFYDVMCHFLLAGLTMHRSYTN